MEIVTKLNLNDECYFMKDNEVEKGKILKIEITVTTNYLGDPQPDIFYSVKYGTKNAFEECFEEREIFCTVAECLESLKKKAQLRYD